MFKVSRKAAMPTLFDSIVAIYEVTCGFAPTFVCTPPQVAFTCLVIFFILHTVMEQNTNGKLCVSLTLLWYAPNVQIMGQRTQGTYAC